MRHKLSVRYVSLLMAVCLVFSLLPMSALATETDTTSETTYLAFGSDRHGNGTELTDILTTMVNAVETAGDGDIDFVGLDGDMVNNTASYSTSTLVSEIQAAGLTSAGGVNTEGADPVVGLSYGSHDAGVTDDAGIMLVDKTASGLYYETDEYIIYFIGYDDMINASDAETAAAEFTATMADKDSSKALFIMSHVPLHQRRGDNNGAATWLTAINAVAEEFDTVFLWGHNHTGETDTDKAMYCVTRGGEITPQGGSGAVTINFAYYVNAGYINANGEMSLIGLTDDAITFQKYTSSGTADDLVTVDRYDRNDSTVAKVITATVYADTFYVGGTFDSASFTVVDDSSTTLTCGTDYTYSLSTDCAAENGDGSWTFTAAGTCTLTVNGAGDYSNLMYVTQFTVEDKPKATSLTDNGTGITVSVAGLEKVEVSDETGNEGDGILTEVTVDGAAYDVVGAYNISLTVNGANYTGSAEVTFPVNLADGTTVYLSDGNTIESSATVTDGSVTFTVPHFSLWYLVTESGTTETDEPTTEITTPEAVTAGSDSTTTIYQLVSSITAGKNYLIVSSNSSGSAYALGHNGTSVASDSVTIYAADNTLSNVVYISADDVDSTSVWTAASGYTFKNGDYYVAVSGSGDSRSLAISNSSTDWSYSSNNNTLSYSTTGGMSKTYYLYYNSNNSNSGWTVGNNSGNSKVYLYEETTVTTSISASYYLDVTANNNGNLYDYNGDYTYTAYGVDSTADTATVSLGYAILKDGEQISDTLGGTAAYELVAYTGDTTPTLTDNSLTLTGTGSSAIVKVSYTWTDDDDSEPYTIYNYILVTAAATTYDVAIYQSSTDVTGSTVTMKATTSVDLTATVSMLDESGSSEVKGATVTWSSSNSDFTVENGTVTYNGSAASAVTTITVTYGDGTSATVTVSYTDSAYTVPADGTDDFPEYPDEGAIRFDKTATGVSWASTGVAQVELSLTGVPYTTGSEIDVVLMIDMTGSMTTDRVSAAKAAAIAFLEAIVLNEDGSYNSNQIAIYSFNNSGVKTVTSLTTVSSSSELSTLESAINALTTANGGTPYASSMAQVYSTLQSSTKDATSQYVVFMSDGCPTTLEVVDSSSSSGHTTYNTSNIQSMFNSGYTAKSDSYKDEYYSSLLKESGVSIYTIGLLLNNTNTAWSGVSAAGCYYAASTILSDMSSGSGYYYECNDSDTVASDLASVLSSIATSIKQAATNTVVTDTISEYYSLYAGGVNFANQDGDNNDSYAASSYPIVVTEYTLDSDHNRSTGTVIATVVLTTDSNGDITGATVTYADRSTATATVTGDVLTIYYSDGVTVLFTYNVATKTFGWNVGTVTSTEIALSYYVLLNEEYWDSADTYPTNTEAYVTYTNYQDNDCLQYFPEPQLTWQGAQVSYVFYLVNEDGEPVNHAGKVVPMSEAIYVTDVYTISTLWSDGYEALDASLLASDLLPSVYTLYDSRASYQIYVGADDDDDSESYFIIAGADGDITTYVFNNKSDTTKYNEHGTYTVDGADNTNKVDSNFIYTDTTVAFAVVWTPRLNEDTVVIDYGLSVTANVATNDLLTGTITGISTTAPNVSINSGSYTTSQMSDTTQTLEHGTATLSGSTITYTPTDMNISEPVTIYYESQVSYYVGSTLQTSYMYSSLTVIPATSVYYEAEDFVIFADGTSATWETTGTSSATSQDTDRPGANLIGSSYDDADNVYGYDSAYTDDVEYSNGKYATVSVSSGTAYADLPTATFTFTGTGFDIYSNTASTQSMIRVDVYAVTGEETATTATKTASVLNTGDNYLYQVPVLSIEGLNYGTYYVVVHAYGAYTNETYTALSRGDQTIIDAVRVYNPAQGNDTAEAAYALDSEANAVVNELRNAVIDAGDYDATETTTKEGILFLDPNGSDGTVVSYEAVGPNNEIYFANNSTAAGFILEVSAIPESVQIGAKSANGISATLNVAIGSASGTVLTQALTTATAMNYVIEIPESAWTEVKDDDGNTTYQVYLYVSNAATSGGGILSVTDLKVTFAESGNIAEFKYNTNVVTNYEEASSSSTATTPKIQSAEITNSRVRYGRETTIKVVTSAAIGEDYTFSIDLGGRIYSTSSTGLYKLTVSSGTADGDGTYTYTLTLKPYTYAGNSESTFTIYLLDDSGGYVSTATVLARIYLL